MLFTFGRQLLIITSDFHSGGDPVERTANDEASLSTSMLIKIISEQGERNLNRLLKELDVTAPQMRALYTIQTAGEPIPEKQLEERLYISQPSTVGLVRRLENKGLLMTTPSPNDGRSILLQLTPKGEAVCQQSKQAMEYGRTCMERGFSEEEKRQLHNLLYQVYENMSYDEERGTRHSCLKP